MDELNMDKHTPGPWTIVGDTDAAEAYVCGLDGCEVAQLVDTVHPPAERLANARLIAAAPDLLAACGNVNEEWHLAHDALKRGDTETVFKFLNSWQDATRAAIARAEGG